MNNDETMRLSFATKTSVTLVLKVYHSTRWLTSAPSVRQSTICLTLCLFTAVLFPISKTKYVTYKHYTLMVQDISQTVENQGK